MDGKRSWKKTEETEIDLMDLLYQLCTKWKQIVAFAFVFMVLAGAAGYVRIQKNVGKSDDVMQEETSMTPEEQQTVNDAVHLAEETARLEEYVENSILMQVDPMEKNRVMLLYSVEGTSGRPVTKIVESYLNYLSNGGVAQALKKAGSKSFRVDSRYLTETITAWQKTDNTFILTSGPGRELSGDAGQTVLYIETIGTNETMAKQLAEGIRKALQEHSKVISQTCGKHTLTLLESVAGVVIDSSLFTQQHDKRELLKTYRTNLNAAKESMNTVQKAVFEKTAGKQADTEKSMGMETASGRFPVKYLLIGCAAGVFIYCLCFTARYLVLDTVKSTAEFRSYYHLPLYGTISMKQKKKSRHVDGQEQILSRIRLACRKHGIQKLCLAADFMPSQPERLCLEQMAQQLQEQGIASVTLEDIGKNADVWDIAADMGTVLIVCRIGSSTHQMIDREMEVYLENGITVLGAAIVEGV